MTGSFSAFSAPSVAMDHPVKAAVLAKLPWLRGKIEAIRHLQANWDGFGAEPIDPVVAQTIEQLLVALLPMGAREGAIVPGADGSLQAEWHLPTLSVGLLVNDDLAVSCWALAAGSDVEVEKFGTSAREMFRSIASVSLA